ncbi:MAG: phosphoribosylformylglycinamidine synthase subunit PurQ [Lachnospiraceae bacterium]|jgi:phosphoribosylformylglycinamidine synthase|nr:phosphoribosylformylglycinamidine synthase subunit PurQ [Lachnospiraceae bacterium]
MEIRRVYVEKREAFAVRAQELQGELARFLPSGAGRRVRVLVRYDIENLSEATYQEALHTIFSEPPLDLVYEGTFPIEAGERVFTVEYLPGQFDQRADSAVQCVQLLDETAEPLIRSGTTYVVSGVKDDEEWERIKSYCINPVDSRCASEEKPDTLETEYEAPADIEILEGFAGMPEGDLGELYESLHLAMTLDDFRHIRGYFSREGRNPYMTEIRVLDTYWSDHCRHTTFQTELTGVEFGEGYYREAIQGTYRRYLADREEVERKRTAGKADAQMDAQTDGGLPTGSGVEMDAAGAGAGPGVQAVDSSHEAESGGANGSGRYPCLMDLALCAMRKLKQEGKLTDLEESEEINACSIVVPVEVWEDDGAGSGHAAADVGVSGSDGGAGSGYAAADVGMSGSDDGAGSGHAAADVGMSGSDGGAGSGHAAADMGAPGSDGGAGSGYAAAYMGASGSDGETGARPSRIEEWLVNFKNETHNHPTEIEPFGGAATCLGGAIRDPLSGRTYVYQAMRITGAADPTGPMAGTLKGKLPQRKIVQGAAQGYSSYGNQIGLATGYVKEIYHPGYVAKRMEIGAVMGAAPRSHVVRASCAPGDKVILLGGRTGRDGIGGATGSSKAHTKSSIEVCGAEVQKGNAPTERKIQRLFSRPEASLLIKKCNDFGAGGVSVAVGELAPGLHIYLDNVPKKYAGLDGTELAISESQERMAVVVAPESLDEFLGYAAQENLEAVEVAEVTASPRLVMEWRGKTIVDIARAFLDTNGAHQTCRAFVGSPDRAAGPFGGGGVPAAADFRGGDAAFADRGTASDAATAGASGGSQVGSGETGCTETDAAGTDAAGTDAATAEAARERFLGVFSDLNVCSQKGLVEMFDSSIGAGTVQMPYGGRYQLSEIQTMVAKLPLVQGRTDAVTMMSYGFDPALSQWSPYHGAAYGVLHSVAKIAAAGGDVGKVHFTFQEYFRRMTGDPATWGEPLSALLGAYDAQMKLGLASVGGKDSMSGSFFDEAGRELHVPPTLVSFAVCMGKGGEMVSTEFKSPGSRLVLVSVPRDQYDLPQYSAAMERYGKIYRYVQGGKIRSAFALGRYGVAEAIGKMAFGNMLGVRLYDGAEAVKGDGAHPYDAAQGGRPYDAAFVMKGDCARLYDGAQRVEAPEASGTVTGNCARLYDGADEDRIYSPAWGDVLLEMDEKAAAEFIAGGAGCARVIGEVTADPVFVLQGSDGGAVRVSVEEVLEAWKRPLESVFPSVAGAGGETLPQVLYRGMSGGGSGTKGSAPAPAAPPRRQDTGTVADAWMPDAGVSDAATPDAGVSVAAARTGHAGFPIARPRVFIPVFPGTNCEFDSAKAFQRAGAIVHAVVFANQDAAQIRESVGRYREEIAQAQIVMFPGGFSAGDEPDGTAKFFATAFRNAALKEALSDLMERRDGLILGVCNGFQALIKLGLVPFGDVVPQGEDAPTLAMNAIGRHVSKMVYTQVVSDLSPWLKRATVGHVYCNPASHGEGRFVAGGDWLARLFANGQVATRYVDGDGRPTMDGEWNPNGSYMAVEGITSPDGRIFGKMAHVERRGEHVAKNITGDQDMGVFESGVGYFL